MSRIDETKREVSKLTYESQSSSPKLAKSAQIRQNRQLAEQMLSLQMYQGPRPKILEGFPEKECDYRLYDRTAAACEKMSDAVMGNPHSLSRRIVRGLTAKLNIDDSSAGIFLVSSVLDNKSARTADGVLFRTSYPDTTLARMGADSLILETISEDGEVDTKATLAVQASKKFLYDEKPMLSDLEAQEREFVEACLALAIAFREQAKVGKHIDAVTMKYLYYNAVVPLCDKLIYLRESTENTRSISRIALKVASGKWLELAEVLKFWALALPNVLVDAVGIVFLKLIAGDTLGLSSKEMFAIDALRKTSLELAQETDEQLASYIQGLAPEPLSKLYNRVKRTYRDMRHSASESGDGQLYSAELYEATNQPEAGIRITNLETDETWEKQLNAATYMLAMEEHNRHLETLNASATAGGLFTDLTVASTRVPSKDLTEKLRTVVEESDTCYSSGVRDSLRVSGLLALARNVRLTLKGREMSDVERHRLNKGGAVSASAAGILALLL